MKISDNLKFRIKELGRRLPFLRRSAHFSPGISLDLSFELLSVDYLPLRKNDHEPSIEFPTSQLCTASQFQSPTYKGWCKKMRESVRFHRKQWEFVYILQSLLIGGMLVKGKRGLGFGCGKEPLPAVMASFGCEILATDQSKTSATDQGWSKSGMHSEKLEDLFLSSILPREDFFKLVSFAAVDMNHIPDDLEEFDFVWSACAFEHLGSIEKGLSFVLDSARCLKPGGMAVHTTEFNLGSNEGTFESEGLTLYRKKDIDELVKRCKKEGFEVMPLNLTLSERVEDDFVDLPPYRSYPHLKLAVRGYLTTSIGLIIKRTSFSMCP